MSVKWLAITLLLVIIMGVAAAFGGYSYGHAAGLNDAQNIRNQFFAARGTTGQGASGGTGAGGAGGTGGQGGARQFGSGNFTNGQVKAVNADSIELSTATEVLKVQVTGQTQIQKTTSAKLSDLQAGERVTVEGTPNADGTFTAQLIQAGGSAFGGRGGQGGGAGAGAGQGGVPAPTSQP